MDLQICSHLQSGLPYLYPFQVETQQQIILRWWVNSYFMPIKLGPPDFIIPNILPFQSFIDPIFLLFNTLFPQIFQNFINITIVFNTDLNYLRLELSSTRSESEWAKA